MASGSHNGLDRRALLRKVAAAGAVGWTAPVILSKPAAASGTFTAKCEPTGTLSGTTTNVQWLTCTFGTSNIQISLSFSGGSCPCGGTKLWCTAKTAPGTPFSSSSSTLVYQVGVPFAGTTNVSGQVAMGCTDRDGDVQWLVYDWTMSVSDTGGACNTAFSATNPVLSNRRFVCQASCPLPAAFAVAAASAIAAPSDGRPID